MSDTVWQAPLTCPACGVPAATRLCRMHRTAAGDDLDCAVCGLRIWEGQLLDRGRDLADDEVDAEVARRLSLSLPLADPLRAVPPEDRAVGLAVGVDLGHAQLAPLPPSSVTVRWPRPARFARAGR
jgi:hypothetical protein